MRKVLDEFPYTIEQFEAQLAYFPPETEFESGSATHCPVAEVVKNDCIFLYNNGIDNPERAIVLATVDNLYIDIENFVDGQSKPLNLFHAIIPQWVRRFMRRVDRFDKVTIADVLRILHEEKAKMAALELVS